MKLSIDELTRLIEAVEFRNEFLEWEYSGVEEEYEVTDTIRANRILIKKLQKELDVKMVS